MLVYACTSLSKIMSLCSTMTTGLLILKCSTIPLIVVMEPGTVMSSPLILSFTNSPPLVGCLLCPMHIYISRLPGLDQRRVKFPIKQQYQPPQQLLLLSYFQE